MPKRPRRTKKQPTQIHASPFHVFLTPIEFELPLIYNPELDFRQVFLDQSAFGLTPSFITLLNAATTARRALVLHLTQVSTEFTGSTPLHLSLQLKRRTNMLYTQGKVLKSLVDAYLHPLSKLCALHDSRHIIESGECIFKWSDMSPALNNRKEMSTRYHKLVSEQYVEKDKSTGDLIYIMKNKSIHFERFNVMFLKGVLYYIEAGRKMHLLKHTASAKLLAEIWHTLQEAAGVFQHIRQISIKFSYLTSAVRSVSVDSPSLRVLANFVSLQQHFVALGVTIQKGSNHGQIANECCEFFATSQVVVDMAISTLDISLSPQTKPLRDICQFMNLFLRGLYFKHSGTQRAASKQWKTAEIAMDLAYRSFNAKVKAHVNAMEGGPMPMSHAIKEECDDAYKNTTDFGNEHKDKSGIPQIRQKLLSGLTVGDLSVLSRKMGSELTFVPFASHTGPIDSYLVRKGAGGAINMKKVTRATTNDTLRSAFPLQDTTDELGKPRLIRSMSYIEGERIKTLLKDKPAQQDFLAQGQHLPDMFVEDQEQDLDSTEYHYQDANKTPGKKMSHREQNRIKRNQQLEGVNWSSTKNGQQKVFFERIMTNHELASRGVFLERKKIRPTSASSAASPRNDGSSTGSNSNGNASSSSSPRSTTLTPNVNDSNDSKALPLFVPPLRDQLCAMCENTYADLPGTVTQNSILKFRGEITTRPASWKYKPVNVCAFCLQFHYQKGGAMASSPLNRASSLPNLKLTNRSKSNDIAASMHFERTPSQLLLHQMKRNLAPQDRHNLAAMDEAHKQKNYRRRRRQSSLKMNMTESMLHALEREEEDMDSIALHDIHDGVQSLEKIDLQRCMGLSRIPKQALFTRGEKSAAGKVNELFYNMASQYENDDEYDLWADYLEEYFMQSDELGSIRTFFMRVSEKPKSQLHASNMTMEGTVSLSVLLDLLSEGPTGDWRVQNILRSSQQVNHMMRSGIGASIRLNDADRMGDITYHQFLAIVKSSNDPWDETEHRTELDGGGSSIMDISTAELWTLPGKDRSAILADFEDIQRKLDIRSVSEGVVGGANHLRHIEHADAQYYRVRDLIRSMNVVLLPGETSQMRKKRHKKGQMNQEVINLHKAREEREIEKQKHQELLELQRKSHELGNLQLSSSERAKLAAEGGGVLNIHKRKCALCTRLFSKPNLPTQATRAAVEDLRRHLAEKQEKRILLAKFQGKRVEIKSNKEYSILDIHDKQKKELSEFVSIRQFDHGHDAFVVVHSNGRKKLHPWKRAREWKLFARTKADVQHLKDKEEEKENDLRQQERESKSESHQADLPPGGRRASRWGKAKGATSVFGGAVRAKKKTIHLQTQAELREMQEKSKQALLKLSQLKAGGKARRIANRKKATRMRAYDRIRLCVFCTQFYTHHVETESKNFIELKAPNPKVPVFESIRDMMKEEKEEERKKEEEEERRKAEEDSINPITIEENFALQKNVYRTLDRLPELDEQEQDREYNGGHQNHHEQEFTPGNSIVMPEIQYIEEDIDDEEAQNIVNDLMTALGLNLAKIGDIAYKRLQVENSSAKLIDRLRYLAAIRMQSSARSFLVRSRMIRAVCKEMNLLKGGISEFQEKIDELRAKKRVLLKQKRERKKEMKKRKALANARTRK